MKMRDHDTTRQHGIAALTALVAIFACGLAACGFAAKAGAAPLSAVDPRVVQVPSSLDPSGDRVSGALERAVASSNFTSMPTAVMQAHSAIAIAKGMGESTSTVVDAMVALDHAPTAADIAAIAKLGFTVKDVYSRTVYALHVIGPVPLGVQSLRDLANATKGIVYVEQNNIEHLMLANSTRQIRARQSWPVYEDYNQGLPLTGDPNRSIVIMDTGIDGTHPDLNGGTATAPGDKIMGWYDPLYGSTIAEDPDGHGSHVAGIAAGTGVSSNADAANGLATGTGHLPLTLRLANYQYIDPTSIEDPDDSIPIDTTGFPGPYAAMPMSMYWTPSQPGYSEEFNVLDRTDGTDGTAWGQVTASDGGEDQPVVGTADVPTGVRGDGFGEFTSDSDAYMGFAVHLLAPETAIGDGFNLETGVAPSSSLVGVQIGDPTTGNLDESSILSGFEFISVNQARYNIGVVNMSFGTTVIDPLQDAAVDNLVSQGIVCCVSAGNNRELVGSATNPVPAGIFSPASASSAITVAAVGNENQIAEYSSFAVAGEDKPDVSAPGGSMPFMGTGNDENADTDYEHDGAITSVDSNTNDAIPGDPYIAGEPTLYIPNEDPDSYTEDEGTSMASPHVAGAVALLEQALGMRGAAAGQSYSGGDEALLVKALLEMTSSDTNQGVDGSAGPGDADNPSPVLRHLGRDPSEGWGKINVDAALSAVLKTYVPGDTDSATLGTDSLSTGANPAFSQMAFAENVTLQGGTTYVFTTTAGTNDAADSEFDLILYGGQPTEGGTVSGGSNGDPIPLATSSTLDSVAQQIYYTPTYTETDYIVVKWQSGTGSFTLTSGTLAAPPTGTATVTPIAIPISSETVNVVSASTGAVIPDAVATLTAANGQQVNMGATGSSGAVTLTTPVSTSVVAAASALGYYTNSVTAVTGPSGAPESITIRLTPSHEFSTGLQLISVPFEYSSTLEQETLPSVYMAAVWNPTDFDYTLSPTYPADQFHIGQGYWVRFREDTSIPVAGTTVASSSYSIPLSTGWNMVGCPYATAVALADATVTVGKGSTSLANAVNAGEVSVLYDYNPAIGAYTAISASSTMQPYVGYWIYSSGAATLVINNGPPPPP